MSVTYKVLQYTSYVLELDERMNDSTLQTRVVIAVFLNYRLFYKHGRTLTFCSEPFNILVKIQILFRLTYVHILLSYNFEKYNII